MEHFALMNNFRVTKKLLITKFDCIYVRVKRDNLRNVASVAHFWLTFGQNVITQLTVTQSCNVDCK